MRKEFTAISAFSTIIAFTAGAVLCMQISQLPLEIDLTISPPVLWGTEAVVFGTAVYAWRRRVTLPGWVVGIAGLLGVRLAILSTAGLLLFVMRGIEDMSVALAQSSTLVTRGCAVLFALMVCYPLRCLLPQRSALRKKRAFGDSAAVRSAEAQSESGLLIVTVKDNKTKDAEVVDDQHVGPGPATVPVGSLSLEGELTLPASTVLALLPQSMVTDKALGLGERESVTIPLGGIHPQLKEAQVFFSVSEVRSWLPNSIQKALTAGEGEAELASSPVIFPLEAIIPQLPPEALELPPPSPPAWANADTEETLVFAKT
ncbi:MAG: hypothetical protein JXA57_06415 [Armatimonadetes bacterium]|nr:hypothetical protein [Armatimonadota bacterium]